MNTIQPEQAQSDEPQPRLWTADYTRVWLGNFFLFFSFHMILPLLPLYLAETFHADKQMIGLTLSGYVITTLIVRFFSGYMVDSFPRKQMLIICYALFSAIFGLYLVAGSLTIFAVLRTLHGAPFGATTVSSSTVAIDVLHPKRRAEGIGYYGLSNNLAVALAPMTAIYVYHYFNSFELLFVLSLLSAIGGVIIDAGITTRQRPLKPRVRQPLSFDRFFLVGAWSQSLAEALIAIAYGILTTYLAIYSHQVLGKSDSIGLFFFIFAVGLILSRLVGSRTLRRGRITENATHGLLLTVAGYLLFVLVHNDFGYYGAAFIIGLGNGHVYPALQTMFINLAPNSMRGTANSSYLVSFDVGMGAGMIIGGFVAEHMGYEEAFWTAAAVDIAGTLLFMLDSSRRYHRHLQRR